VELFKVVVCMTQRITDSQLQAKVDHLNEISKVKYELYYRYGHVSMVNADTRRDITSCGTKYSVYYEIDAITSWLSEERKAQQVTA